MTDRFAHDLRLDQIRDGERLDLVADDVEREAIRTRLNLLSIERMEAHVTLTRTADEIRADGRIFASVRQSCVVTGDPVSAHVDEPFAIRFVPEPSGVRPDEEIELDNSDCDTLFYDSACVDLGTAIADTLALSLNPYPRSAGAEAALKEAGVLTEEQASPFAVLAQLKQNDKPA